jgi:2-polyprenyl-6-methoxyphenol hydroxylase-like FAD-dependent oxidoreductase
MNTSTDSLQVLIVGAGIGGLFLATLLERARIPYAIFERAPTVRPLGKARTVSMIATQSSTRWTSAF